ncbi:hypothetical protein FisN_13Lh227 [Fistulifera solaris]|uniref:tRNA-splicing endonuclease subunit Sen54 N-terminal domain-containing protein n=1 Tax=Fistulifera solaris TaxID=1519565 RepID=A0A1Z5KM20_FISSO|nr:hypothetical protein FisN_13Lh227 [Fistulifera solaris]|eukprot:GAX27217.1 hypothetical protein FisN_13Lh227 [Fistulifera solaris]
MISHDAEKMEVPIACRLDRTRKLFRITRNKGKSLANGGFGCLLPDESSPEHIMVDYLFIEEVYFLVERGLLEAFDGDKLLDTQGIFQLLEECGMTLFALLVYAHVRSQNYRVIRHTPYRRRILEEMEPLRHLYKKKKSPETEDKERDQQHIATIISSSSVKEPANNPTSTRQQLELLRQQLREDGAQAPAPVVAHGDRMATIAYELYLPDSQFRRSAPGLPDIYVTATTSLHFDALQTLLQEANGIPLRTAVVSEAGTVVMLGVTDYGVPAISKAGLSKNKCVSTAK